MTNRLRTVQNPKLILVECSEAVKISEIISDILNYCSYNTVVDSFDKNTDFIISTDRNSIIRYKNVITDTVVFDEKSEISEEVVSLFANRVTSYEHCFVRYNDSQEKILTYSCENYAAEVTARNISAEDNITSFDIIAQGILIRVRTGSKIYSVMEVLMCTAVLVAAGIPVASILRYFTDFDKK